MPPSRPMTPQLDWAQISPTVVIYASHRHGRLDRRMRVVVDDRHVVEGVVEDRITRCQNKFRVRSRIAGQLLGDLLDVIVVDVAVTAGPDELAHVEPGL